MRTPDELTIGAILAGSGETGPSVLILKTGLH